MERWQDKDEIRVVVEEVEDQELVEDVVVVVMQ